MLGGQFVPRPLPLFCFDFTLDSSIIDKLEKKV